MKGTPLSELDAAVGPHRGFLPEQFYDAQCVRPTILGSSHEAPPRRRGDQSVRGAARGSVRGKIESG
jgi:hypothetical protein